MCPCRQNGFSMGQDTSSDKHTSARQTLEPETQPPWTCRNQTTNHMRTDDDWKVNPEMCEDTKSESSFCLWRNDEEEWQSLQKKKNKKKKKKKCQSDEKDPTMESTSLRLSSCDLSPFSPLGLHTCDITPLLCFFSRHRAAIREEIWCAQFFRLAL